MIYDNLSDVAEVIVTIAITFFIALLFISIILFGAIQIGNAITVSKCNVLKDNGHNTHIETIFGINKVCYIGDVPYSRFISERVENE